MTFSIFKFAGTEVIDALHSRRAAFRTTGEYPFLIGDEQEVERIKEAAEYNQQTFDEIINGAGNVDLVDWLRRRRAEAEEYDFSTDEMLGEWPGEISEKGSISRHLDLLTGKIIKDVYLGLAKIDEPWKLPAMLKYGGWNDCPDPEVHCAFHRKWQAEFGAEIVGISSDVVECVVSNPPRNRDAAIDLAWHQYWYCADIVEQGCESVSNLAATLLNSNHWYFWWD